MRTFIAAILLIGVASTTACEKTGEGEYEVQKPVIGTETDTVNTPTVDVGTEVDTVEIRRPTVDVDAPN